MSHPDQPTPTTPNQYWPPQPQAYGPPPGYPAPAGPPVKPPNSKLVFWTSPTGIICMLLIMGAVVAIIVGVTNRLSGPASDNFEITVTSCDATAGPLSTAKVGFTIKNTSSTPRSATVQIEYRDGAGSRLDTDTAHVQTIQPGDTVRHDESTILDAEAAGAIQCAITGIS
jgi:hypothetical protein